MVELRITAHDDGDRYKDGHFVSVPDLVKLLDKYLIDNFDGYINTELYVKNWLKHKDDEYNRRTGKAQRDCQNRKATRGL